MDPRQREFSRVIAMAASVLLIVALAAGCAAPTAAPTAAPAAAKHKVAYFTAALSTVGAYEIANSTAFKHMCDKYGFECTVVESLPNANAPEAARALAAAGYEAIVTLDNGYETSFGDAAADIPQMMFVIMQFVTSNKGLPNFAAFSQQPQPIWYQVGYAAALASKTGKIAFITGQPISAVSAMYAGVTDGAKYANPNVEVMIKYTNDWADNSKSKEATLAAIDEGADVILPILGSADEGAYTAAKERNVGVVGYYTDQCSRAPKTVLFSQLYDVEKSYDTLGGLLAKGQLKGQIYEAGLPEGYAGLGPCSVSAEVLAKAETLRQDIMSGKIKVDTTKMLK